MRQRQTHSKGSTTILPDAPWDVAFCISENGKLCAQMRRFGAADWAQAACTHRFSRNDCATTFLKLEGANKPVISTNPLPTTQVLHAWPGRSCCVVSPLQKSELTASGVELSGMTRST